MFPGGTDWLKKYLKCFFGRGSLFSVIRLISRLADPDPNDSTEADSLPKRQTKDPFGIRDRVVGGLLSACADRCTADEGMGHLIHHYAVQSQIFGKQFGNKIWTNHEQQQNPCDSHCFCSWTIKSSVGGVTEASYTL